jgi:hypothetical protein
MANDQVETPALKRIMLYHLTRLREVTKLGEDLSEELSVPGDKYLNEEYVRESLHHIKTYETLRLIAYKKLRIIHDPMYHKSDIWDTGNGGWPDEENINEAIEALNNLKI